MFSDMCVVILEIDFSVDVLIERMVWIEIWDFYIYRYVLCFCIVN